MEIDPALRQSLKEAGAADDLLAQYQHYLDSGNRQGQKRLLLRFRKLQSAMLKKDREKLACLDYIITKVEETHKLFDLPPE